MSGKGHMTCKVYLYNFCNTYAAFSTMSVLQKPNAFIFALVFTKSLSEELYTKKFLFIKTKVRFVAAAWNVWKRLEKEFIFQKKMKIILMNWKKSLTEYYYVWNANLFTDVYVT